MVLVALTYTGTRSIYSSQGMKQEGGYPATDQFMGPGPSDDEGETKLVMLPSSRLGWWENHGSFEVDYTPEAVAETLLDRNYISEQIVGPGFNTSIRNVVMEKLGLEPFAGEDDLREQLRDVAGYSEDEIEEDEQSQSEPASSRLSELETNDRSVLIKVANSYDDIDSLLEQEEVNSVSHLSQGALASFLESKDDDEVDRRVSTAEQGGEL